MICKINFRLGQTKLETSGVKIKIRMRKSRLIVLFAAFLILIVTVSLVWVYSANQPADTINPPSQSTAAIVDQLGLLYPNETFAQTATSMLETAGFSVDYYSGEQVTVDFFRSLAAYQYKIIILRVHGATSVDLHSVALFTSETFNESKYESDLKHFYLGRAAFPHQRADEPGYFAITSNFVKEKMPGTFNQTTIIMMGCYGLEYPNMAEAFIQKGAQAYISWNGSVAADHTDETTANLLEHLILEKETVAQAVANVMSENGPDPVDRSIVTYFPQDIGAKTVPNP